LLTIRVRSGNEGAEVGESGCRWRENTISEKDLCRHKKKVVEELMKQVGKDKPGSKETFTVISIDSKLKFIRKGRAGAA